MPFICNGDRLAYIRRLNTLFRRYCERSAEQKGFDWLSLCCLEPAYDMCFLVHDAVNWRLELDFDRLQRMNVREHRFVGWHDLEMFAILPRERDMLYEAV